MATMSAKITKIPRSEYQLFPALFSDKNGRNGDKTKVNNYDHSLQEKTISLCQLVQPSYSAGPTRKKKISRYLFCRPIVLMAAEPPQSACESTVTVGRARGKIGQNN